MQFLKRLVKIFLPGRSDPPPAGLPVLEINDYRLIRTIGQTAGSAIYLAESSSRNNASFQLGSAAAENLAGFDRMGENQSSLAVIKVCLAPEEEPNVRARFQQEVELASRVSSPFVIPVIESGETPYRQRYYVMEYVNGCDLAKVVQMTGPMSDGRLLAILKQLCQAVGSFHDLGMVHRDIKPSNILLTPFADESQKVSESIKLFDFGLTQSLERQAAPGMDGVVSGTPHYLAPELWESADRFDVRSDLYAIGCSAYHLLTGKTPFQGNNPLEICAKHLRHQPDNISKLGLEIAPQLADLVMQCLSKSPVDRPASTTIIANELEHIVPYKPWSELDSELWWRNYSRQVTAD